MFPEGLSQDQFRILHRCTKEAEKQELSDVVTRAKDHLDRVRQAYLINPVINIGTAQAVLRVILTIRDDWSAMPSLAQPWLRGAIHYFATREDDIDDFNSPIGFDDDAEVLNACLRLAGRDDLCIDPEDCEDA